MWKFSNNKGEWMRRKMSFCWTNVVLGDWFIWLTRLVSRVVSLTWFWNNLLLRDYVFLLIKTIKREKERENINVIWVLKKKLSKSCTNIITIFFFEKFGYLCCKRYRNFLNFYLFVLTFFKKKMYLC